MIKQKSLIANNNKENNAVISNIEKENVDEQEFVQYSYGKIQPQNGISMPTSNNSVNLTIKNDKNNNNKRFVASNSMPLDENYCYESNSTYQSSN